MLLLSFLLPKQPFNRGLINIMKCIKILKTEVIQLKVNIIVIVYRLRQLLIMVNVTYSSQSRIKVQAGTCKNLYKALKMINNLLTVLVKQ